MALIADSAPRWTARRGVTPHSGVRFSTGHRGDQPLLGAWVPGLQPHPLQTLDILFSFNRSRFSPSQSRRPPDGQKAQLPTPSPVFIISPLSIRGMLFCVRVIESLIKLAFLSTVIYFRHSTEHFMHKTVRRLSGVKCALGATK
ncbi:hypothetical protein MTP99_009273 [Tenebrio molitor]|nr:hypothetical protein MTP99_009273 [Tenebrio molitor]